MTTLTLEAAPETEVLLYGPASAGTADLLFEGVIEDFPIEWDWKKHPEVTVVLRGSELLDNEEDACLLNSDAFSYEI